MKRALLAAALVACGSKAPPSVTQAPRVENRPVQAVDPTAPLFKDLPGGNFAIAGGNILRMQDVLQASLMKVLQPFMKSAGLEKQFKKYVDCFASHHEMRAATSLALRDGQVEMRTAMSGFTIAEVAECAKRADFPTKIDGDGKYVEVELTVMQQTSHFGFLELADHALYARQTLALKGQPIAALRADLEADVTAAAKRSAADDTALFDLAHGLDHSQMVWFAGTADATPLAQTLGEFYGTCDLTDGFRVDVTLQVLDAHMREKVLKEFAELQEHASDLPASFRAALQGTSLTSDADRLHLVIKWSEAQFAALFDAAGPRKRDADDSRTPRKQGATDFSEPIAKMNEFKDKMCACHDSTCAQQVSDEMTAWGRQMAKSDRFTGKPSDAEMKQMADITKQMTDCMTAAMNAGGP